MGRLEIPLNRAGTLQARRMATIVRRLNIDAIYTSPLKRALQTAQILAEKTGLPVEIDPNLIEVAFGRWEGWQLKRLRRDKAYHRFLRAPVTAKVPGGETMRDVQKRGLAALWRAAGEHPEGRILFVTHGDVIRAILCHHLHLSLGEFRRLRIDNGSLTVLEVNGSWAELKFINYVPDIVPITQEPYGGLDPVQLRRGIKGSRVKGLKGNEKPKGRRRASRR